MDTACAFPGPSPAGHPTDGRISVSGPGPGREDVPRPRPETRRAALLPADAGRSHVRAGLDAVCRFPPPVQPGRDPLHLCDTSPAAPDAAQPAASRPRERAPRLQHGGEFHHEHQLAELRGGVDDVVPLPDGRACPSQFHLRRLRHRRGRGARARDRPAQRENGGELHGGPGADDPVSAAPFLPPLRDLPGFPGDDPELQAV